MSTMTDKWVPVRASAIRRIGDTFTMRPGDPSMIVSRIRPSGSVDTTDTAGRDAGGLITVTDWAVYVAPSSPIRRRKGARF